MNKEFEPGRLNNTIQAMHDMVRSPAVIASTIALAVGATAANEVRTEEAFGTEAKAAQIEPSEAWSIITNVRQSAINQNLGNGSTFRGPTEPEIHNGLIHLVDHQVVDPLSQVQLTGTNSGSIRTKITQDNKRFRIGVASFQDLDDLDGDRLRNVEINFDADVFAKKTLKARIVKMPLTRGAKPVPYGSWKKLPNWDNLSVNSAARVGTGRQADAIETHTGVITVKPKAPLTAAQKKSGKYFLQIQQTCEVTDPSYDSGKACDTGEERSFRIKGSKTSYNVKRRAPSLGDLIVKKFAA